MNLKIAFKIAELSSDTIPIGFIKKITLPLIGFLQNIVKQ